MQITPATPENKQISPLELVKYNLNKNYLAQVTNFYDGDKRAAMRFMTGFIDHVRRQPKLLQCTTLSLINSAMMVASFRFTLSTVAGEAYLIPYKNNGVLEAQFQPGYQGYVTLFYRAGVRAIQGEIVREHDEFTLENGVPVHKVDPRKNRISRGKAIGAFVKVILPSGEAVYKYMNGDDIISHAKKFSKAFNKDDSPWKESNDPELHMWKKTVLLQMKSMLPKNSELLRAMEEDFKDSTVSTSSVISDRLEVAKDESEPLKLKNLNGKNNETSKTDNKKEENPEDNQDGSPSAEDNQGHPTYDEQQ